MSLPAPRYSIWQVLSTALALGQRALEEVRTLAREPGPPGPPAFGFDDMTFEHDGERGFTLRFERGEQIKEFKFSVPVVIDRGVWKEGSFQKGDGVTWGGSFWIAQKDTETKPDTPNSDWRLSIKRGGAGASAYDIARKGGFKGGEREWLDSLKGKPGENAKPIRDARSYR